MKYKIVDDTDCEVLYFDTPAQVSRYVKNHKNHLMTSYVLVSHSSCENYLGRWQEMQYYGVAR